MKNPISSMYYRKGKNRCISKQCFHLQKLNHVKITNKNMRFPGPLSYIIEIEDRMEVDDGNHR